MNAIVFDAPEIPAIPFARLAGRSALVLAFAALCGASPAWAVPLLGSAEAFAVLGASTVTNTGSTTITGKLGVHAGSAITGMSGITVNGTDATGNADVHAADAVAETAQSHLAAAMTSLGLLGSGLTIPGGDLDAWQLSHGGFIIPGVYTVPGGGINLTGTLILDGQGNANAAWVFQMESSLITASGSVVDVINTGAGAGVFWVLPTTGGSATLGTNSEFEGNILAQISITLATGATIDCGRALARVGAVTMDSNTVSIGCAGTGEEGSNGLSGGLEVTDIGGPPVFLPVLPIAAAPEPGTLLLLGFGLVGLTGFARRRTVAPSPRVTSSA